jgi:hypothetical protein
MYNLHGRLNAYVPCQELRPRLLDSTPPPPPPLPASYQPPALDPTRVALLIETRPDPILPALLSHFILAVPPTWGVKMAGTPESFHRVRHSAMLAPHLAAGKLELVDLPDSYPAYNGEVLSQTLTNRTFYADFLAPAEWLLLFQADSIICAANERSLDYWVSLNYSWVGAPWEYIPGDELIPNGGGNGGLSLRHIPSILEVLDGESREPWSEWEDVWFYRRMNNTAPPHVSMHFSVEEVYSERPLGYHLMHSGRNLYWKIWQNGTRRREIFSYCPEVKILLGNMLLQRPDDEEERLREIEADEAKAEEERRLVEEAARMAMLEQERSTVVVEGW